MQKKETLSLTEKLKYHITDSTALLAESTPVFSVFEVYATKMSNASSVNARLLAGLIAYAVIGYLFGKGRDISRKYFNIHDKTKESIQTLHDVAYTAGFNFLISPPMYAISQTLANEELDIKKIAIGTLLAGIFGAINGSPMGYAVDIFRDLSGIKECKRPSYPKILKKQNKKVKKLVLAGIIGASIGITSLIYSSTAYNNTNLEYKSVISIEQSQKNRLETIIKTYN